MKTIQHFFFVVLFIVLSKVVLIFKSVDENPGKYAERSCIFDISVLQHVLRYL